MSNNNQNGHKTTNQLNTNPPTHVASNGVAENGSKLNTSNMHPEHGSQSHVADIHFYNDFEACLEALAEIWGIPGYISTPDIAPDSKSENVTYYIGATTRVDNVSALSYNGIILTISRSLLLEMSSFTVHLHNNAERGSRDTHIPGITHMKINYSSKFVDVFTRDSDKSSPQPVYRIYSDGTVKSGTELVNIPMTTP